MAKVKTLRTKKLPASAKTDEAKALAIIKQAREILGRPDTWIKGNVAAPNKAEVTRLAKELIREEIPAFRLSLREAKEMIIRDSVFMTTDSPDAAQFCSVGAIERAYYVYGDGPELRPALDIARGALAKTIDPNVEDTYGYEFTSTITDFNDDDATTRTKVLKTFDKTIKNLSEKKA